MENQENIIKTLSIDELLSNNDKYIIPIYQRNYAWGETEIKQLIQDIIDKQKSDSKSKYYLGTLIVDEKTQNNKTYFEVIDGQQRHTTLTLINAYLHKNDSDKKSNLFFDARPQVRKYIDVLYRSYNQAQSLNNLDDSVKNIATGIEIIDNFFSSETDLRDEAIDLGGFEEYFLQNVKIIRVGVPKDTDINHYFEIMNTRGVQLEKHQILKSAFIETIKDDEKSKEFAKIWDACSSMDRYIYKKNLKKINEESKNDEKSEEFAKIGDNYSSMDVDTYKQNLKSDLVSRQNASNNLPKRTLDDILSNKILVDEQKIEETKEARYASIIDFPNFLLQVLRLFKKDETISLDDKNLLEAFGYNKKDLPDPIEFINFLLEIRTLFDKFFIKRQVDESGEVKWKILKSSENTENDYLVNTFKSNKILMIQSMFQVSFSTNSYKNWLHEQLKWLHRNTIYGIEEDKYFEFCCNQAKQYFDNRTKPEWGNSGVHTNHYIFNYLDFLLWKEYDEKVREPINPINVNTLLGRISKQRKYFESFRFTQRSSVEHIHPQSKVSELLAENDEIKKATLNSVGNLCLISRSSNSKYNDYNFQAKKEQFQKKNSTESLKQAIIYSYDEWSKVKIDEHKKEIEDLFKGCSYPETQNKSIS